MNFRKRRSTARLRSIFFTIFNRLENNNNADFTTNGEERFVKDFFSDLHGPVTLFDVGGNVGGYSEILVNLCRQQNLEYALHLFEPTQYCFSVLQKKFGENTRVTLNNFGVSDAESSSEIYYDEQGSGFASLYQRDLQAQHISLTKHEIIRLERLDGYLERKAVKSIDFMKIDIEGHELKAFTGLGKYLSGDFIKAIQFEYGGANLDSRTTLREMYRLLERSGFVIGKIRKNGIEIRPYDPMMENFQYANFAALSKKYFPDAVLS